MKHRRFAVTTPAGEQAWIKGDPNMSPETLAALTEMLDLACAQLLAANRCEACGCSDAWACEGGCSWANTAPHVVQPLRARGGGCGVA